MDMANAPAPASPPAAQPQPGDDIVSCAIKVLSEPDPHRKAAYTNSIAKLWKSGAIGLPALDVLLPLAPDRPARDDKTVRVVPAADAPRRGKGGSLASRIAILHSLVHIESWAIDLSWDIIARFGAHPDYAPLPRAFFDDFVTVAADECRHFLLLQARLEGLGSRYGALTAHDGLWDSACDTAGSLPARLAVEHCCHEARGLDVLPQTIRRFRGGGDEESAALLEGVILPEEVSHCAAGVRWLRFLHARALVQAAGRGGGCEGGGAGAEGAAPLEPAPGDEPAAPEWSRDAAGHLAVEQWFHSLIRRHFFGVLKPPFNEDARAKAGFGPEWYLPLAAAPALLSGGGCGGPR